MTKDTLGTLRARIAAAQSEIAEFHAAALGFAITITALGNQRDEATRRAGADEARIAGLERERDNLKHLARVAHGHLRVVGWPMQNTGQYNSVMLEAIPDAKPVVYADGYFARERQRAEAAEAALRKLADADGPHCCLLDGDGKVLVQHPCTCWRNDARVALEGQPK